MRDTFHFRPGVHRSTSFRQAFFPRGLSQREAKLNRRLVVLCVSSGPPIHPNMSNSEWTDRQKASKKKSLREKGLGLQLDILRKRRGTSEGGKKASSSSKLALARPSIHAENICQGPFSGSRLLCSSCLFIRENCQPSLVCVCFLAQPESEVRRLTWINRPVTLARRASHLRDRVHYSRAQE